MVNFVIVLLVISNLIMLKKYIDVLEMYNDLNEEFSEIEVVIEDIQDNLKSEIKENKKVNLFENDKND